MCIYIENETWYSKNIASKLDWAQKEKEEQDKIALNLSLVYKWLLEKHQKHTLAKEHIPQFIKNGVRQKVVNKKKSNKKSSTIPKPSASLFDWTLLNNQTSSEDESSESSDTEPSMPETITLDFKPHINDDFDKLSERFSLFYKKFSIAFGDDLTKLQLIEEAIKRPKEIWSILSKFPIFEIPAQMFANKLASLITNQINEAGLGRMSNVITPIRNRMSQQALQDHDVIHQDTLNQFCIKKTDRKHVYNLIFMTKLIDAMQWDVKSMEIKKLREEIQNIICDERVRLSFEKYTLKYILIYYYKL